MRVEASAQAFLLHRNISVILGTKRSHFHMVDRLAWGDEQHSPGIGTRRITLPQRTALAMARDFC